MWVIDHVDDLESDFSVFHRVDDLHALPAARFFRLAARIFAYEGVMTARYVAETEKTARRHGGTAQQVKRASVSEMALTHPGVFDRTEV